MPDRPRLLALFAGAGDVARGYHDAGFDVVGVDSRPQPAFPYEFHQADIRLAKFWARFPGPFDAIHVSPPPPCHVTVRFYADLRVALDLTGAMYVIEYPLDRYESNVPLLVPCGALADTALVGRQLITHLHQKVERDEPA